MLIELIVAVIALAFLVDYLSKKRRNDVLGDIPGPSTLPIFGNALMYFNKSTEDIMQFIASNRNKYGPLYRVWVFNQLAIFSCDPKDIEIVLSSPKYITKNRLYDLLHSWLSSGLLLSTDQKWHSRRKIITPTFHFKILEQFVEIFDQQGSVMVEKLKPAADGKTAFNIQPYICLAALDIIAETAMGTKVNAQTDSTCEYVRAVNDVTNIMANRFVNVWYRNDLIFRIMSPSAYKQQTKCIKTMHNFTEKIIKERRSALDLQSGDKKAEQEVTDDIGLKKRMALLDVLLQANVNGKPLSNEDIREEVDTFMFEGHDTTTAGISFALYLVSRHPAVQEKLVQEIKEKLGNDKTTPTNLRDLGELKYLECVIKEALRLFPPVPIIGRYFFEDVNMNGKVIPAGTNYTVGIYTMLRDPELFPDPNTFNPERHTFENTNEKTNPYAYIPFSAGPRNCIGQKFAILEMKSAIAKVVRNYELLPLGPEVKPVLNLIMRSSNGIHLGLKPRV